MAKKKLGRKGSAGRCWIKVCDPRGVAHGVDGCYEKAVGGVMGQNVCTKHRDQIQRGYIYSTIDGTTVHA